MGVKGLGGETAGMNSLELKHLGLNSHVAICYDAIIQMALSAMEKGTINLDWQSSSEKDI